MEEGRRAKVPARPADRMWIEKILEEIVRGLTRVHQQERFGTRGLFLDSA